jgi:hypothetical protein
MSVVSSDPYHEVKTRLRDDYPFYANAYLRVVENQKVVPFRFRDEQQRFWDGLEAQRAEGRAMQALVLKARKIGFSTFTQGLIFQRVTQRPNHNALTIAQDKKTAAELIRMSELMYANLPDHPGLAFLKPPIANQRKSQEIIFGEPARNQTHRGALGLNSKIQIDTAKEFEAGRGHTFHSVHGSEVAFWPDLRRKLTSILNAVPQDDPDTMIILESTANGHNEFREMWVAAIEGRSEYLPFFSPWFHDDRYQRAFLSEEEQEAFKESVGSGPWGEDEPMLLEMGVSYEQLKWRRWMIENRAGSDLQTFQQEYPSTWEEAFATTGKHVFAPLLVKKLRTAVENDVKPAEVVVLKTTTTKPKRGRYVNVDVPTKWKEAEVPEHSLTDLYWRIWDRPEDKGQYVIVVDPASEDEATDGVPDWTAIEVWDHRKRLQVAEMQTRAEKDLVAEQVYLACLMYTVRPNRPLLVVEMTGGYGDFIVSRVYKEYGWNRMYRRKPTDPRRREPDSELLGFSTNRNTKPRLVDGMKERLREGTHGVRSLRVVEEMASYQRTKRGFGSAPGRHDDLLSASMIAHLVMQEVPVRPDRSPGSVVSIATKAIRNPQLGY